MDNEKTVLKFLHFLLKKVVNELEEILFKLPTISFTVIQNQTKFKGVRKMIITNEEKVNVQIENPVTAAGNPARIDGIPNWVVSDTNVISVNVSPDGMSAEIISEAVFPNLPAQAMVTVFADADLGAGVKEINGILDITVIEAQAVSFSFNVAAPVVK